MTERSTVVLVDPDGTETGTADKLGAHRAPGALHLAFSVFLYRPDGRLLLQQRAPGKYHFPGVWANACCSHPLPGEDLVASAERRVAEELGLRCALRAVGRFSYRAECPESGLVEHELDHVLIGVVGEDPRPNADEVADWRWVEVGALLGARAGEGVEPAPGPLAPWVREALDIAEAARSGLVQ